MIVLPQEVENDAVALVQELGPDLGHDPYEVLGTHARHISLVARTVGFGRKRAVAAPVTILVLLG